MKLGDVLPIERIANFFIAKGETEKGGINALKVIKLTYLAQGWALGLYGKPIGDEAPTAYEYGPLFESLYHTLKKYGNDKLKKYRLDEGNKHAQLITAEQQELLNRIWDAHKKYTPEQLSVICRSKKGPWEKAWNNRKNYKNVQIQEKDMIDYYAELGRKNQRKSLKR